MFWQTDQPFPVKTVAHHVIIGQPGISILALRFESRFSVLLQCDTAYHEFKPDGRMFRYFKSMLQTAVQTLKRSVYLSVRQGRPGVANTHKYFCNTDTTQLPTSATPELFLTFQFTNIEKCKFPIFVQ